MTGVCVPLKEGKHIGGNSRPVRILRQYLNNFSRKWSTFEAFVNSVLWWRLLGEELWQRM